MRLDLAVGERRAALALARHGPKGTLVRTAQIRLGLSASVGGTGLLSHVSINLPLLVEVARAEASLSEIACSGLTPDHVTVATRPGIAAAWIGSPHSGRLSDLATGAIDPANILVTPLLSATGSAHVEVAQLQAEALTFTAADIEDGTGAHGRNYRTSWSRS